MTRTPRKYLMTRIKYLQRITELLGKDEELPAPYHKVNIEQASELFNTLNAFGFFAFMKLAEEYKLPKEIFAKEANKNHKEEEAKG